jgi:hypothetical protein
MGWRNQTSRGCLRVRMSYHQHKEHPTSMPYRAAPGEGQTKTRASLSLAFMLSLAPARPSGCIMVGVHQALVLVLLPPSTGVWGRNSRGGLGFGVKPGTRGCSCRHWSRSTGYNRLNAARGEEALETSSPGRASPVNDDTRPVAPTPRTYFKDLAV